MTSGSSDALETAARVWVWVWGGKVLWGVIRGGIRSTYMSSESIESGSPDLCSR